MDHEPAVPDLVGGGEVACPICGTKIGFPIGPLVSSGVSISVVLQCGCGNVLEVMPPGDGL